eukprot:5276192-Pyramimonas_sp.AAC.1
MSARRKNKKKKHELHLDGRAFHVLSVRSLEYLRNKIIVDLVGAGHRCPARANLGRGEVDHVCRSAFRGPRPR